METSIETNLRLPKEGELIELIALERIKGQKTSTRVNQVKRGILSSSGIKIGTRIYVRKECHGCIDITSTIQKIYLKDGKIIIESVATVYELRR